MIDVRELSLVAKTTYYLAVDLGASSGRHMLAWMEDGKIRLKEIYRFENALVKKNGHLCWDLERIFREVINGLLACKDQGYRPKSISIDTWGVDFVLLDKENEVIGDTVSYRDSRTQGMDKEVYKYICESELYSRNGIQKQIFNSIYQLMAIKVWHPEQLKSAAAFLMIPEYLNYLLTGIKMNEYTNATTTQLVNAKSRDWDTELMQTLGIPTHIFGTLHRPGSVVGRLSSAICERVGFDTTVILPATHDTGSAVMAVPTNDDDSIYLSSGTWSLMGIERQVPDCSERSRSHNFTNEGGYDYRYRYLKNIMGLWIMQNIRKEFNHAYTFDELYVLANIANYFSAVIDVNAPDFLAPKSMKQAVQDYCIKTGQDKPETEGELLYCVYHSLAVCYGRTVREIEDVTGKPFSHIYVVGGGCQDRFLNMLLAKETGKEVYAGPVEGTALGNILAQLIVDGVFTTLQEGRIAIRESFDVQRVIPGTRTWTCTF